MLNVTLGMNSQDILASKYGYFSFKEGNYHLPSPLNLIGKCNEMNLTRFKRAIFKRVTKYTLLLQHQDKQQNIPELLSSEIQYQPGGSSGARLQRS